MRGIVIAAIMLAAGMAIADTKPWAAGVSDADKAKAQELLDRGNALFLEKKYVDALDAYRSALKSWDHPGIRFSVVKCLIQLDRPVEAAENLEAALKYGATPFDPSVYNEALSYQKLLAGQIAELEITCDQPGAKLSLDGKPLVTCPATEVRKVAPGQHMIVGTREGYMLKSIEVIALGNKRSRAVMKLVPMAKAAVIVHRWKQWVPWAVIGGGLAGAGIGGLMRWQATSLMDTYGSNVAANCSVKVCPVDYDAETKNAAIRDNAIAIGFISAGAAVAITGGIMLYMNRGRTIYENPVEHAPVVSAGALPGGGFVALHGAF